MISNKASHKTERRKNMTNNKKNYIDFANDKQLSKYAYENAKVFLIASEKKESIYTNYVSDFNYFIVGKVLSMDETRKNHFEMNVEDKQNDLNNYANACEKVFKLISEDKNLKNLKSPIHQTGFKRLTKN